MQQVLVPLLRRMGADVNLFLERPGYVPKGGGIMIAEIAPLGGFLKPLT